MVGWQTVKDRLCSPLLILLSSNQAQSLHLTPIDEERIAIVLGRCRGLVLDIGCGTNELITRYRSPQRMAIGVDVYPWPDIDALCDTTRLPFSAGTFDTITMLACLNHIPASKRDQVLQEAHRVLKDGGQVLMTMINPVVGWVAHTLRHRYDPDQIERGMGHDEEYGLWQQEVNGLLERNDFHIAKTVPFVFGLNRLYIAERLQKDCRKTRVVVRRTGIA